MILDHSSSLRSASNNNQVTLVNKACIFKRQYFSVYLYVCMCMCVFLCVCVSVCVCVCVCVSSYVYDFLVFRYS